MRWMGAILAVLLRGPHRFNELLAAIPGMSDGLLTEGLRDLERHGLATRRVLTSSPGLPHHRTLQGEAAEGGHLSRPLSYASE